MTIRPLTADKWSLRGWNPRVFVPDPFAYHLAEPVGSVPRRPPVDVQSAMRVEVLRRMRGHTGGTAVGDEGGGVVGLMDANRFGDPLRAGSASSSAPPPPIPWLASGRHPSATVAVFHYRTPREGELAPSPLDLRVTCTSGSVAERPGVAATTFDGPRGHPARRSKSRSSLALIP
jgi:hypothetical protein